MHPTLAAIQQRPGMYLGAHNDSFTALCGFIGGYEIGFWAGNPQPQADLVAADVCLVPYDFHRFVTEHYGRTFPDGGKGWQGFVREHADGDQGAFRLFFKLLAEYDRRTQPQNA